jgi:iron complex transport system substrate-binding protein
MPSSRRSFLAGMSAVAAAPLIGSCAEDEPPSQGRSQEAEADAFPATIEHKYGTTEVTATPERVVCVGLIEQDALLALGIVPVAVTDWFGKAPGRIFPWARHLLGNADLPVILNDKDGIREESVAKQAPDLILGLYSGMTQQEYDVLSQMKATVAQPKGYVDYGAPWDVSTKMIGAAVGQPDAAQQLVDDVNAEVERHRGEHPQFEGKRAICGTLYDGLYIYGPEDPRSRMLTSLGFTFPEEFEDVGGGQFGGSISPERAHELDFDCVVWIATEEQVDRQTGGLWADTRAQAEGRTIYVSPGDGPYYIAHSMVTPLSIPYVLDRYVPQLSAAVDGDPNTAVPAPKA